MEELIARLESIVKKVEDLKLHNHSLTEQNLKKEKEIGRLKQLLDIQNHSIKEMENRLKIKRIAEGLNGEESESNRDLKFKINEMIKEVDKIMSLMHQ
jgi:hypothetical protein